MLFCGTKDANVSANCRFRVSPVTWHISPPPRHVAIDGQAVHEQFKRSLDKWASRCGFRHAYQSNPRTAHIRAYWKRLDGPNGVLAQSGLPCGNHGQIVQEYDDGEARWVIADNPPQNSIDFGRVSLHELGHAIGIGHIAQGNIMQAMYSVNLKDLQNGDITEALARYPMLTPPPPVNPPTNPPTIPPMNDDEIVALLKRGNDFWVRLLGKEIKIG
jgi:hypothetical protein